MKKMLNLLILIIVIGGIVLAMSMAVNRKKQSNTIDGILSDITLDKLVHERNDYIQAHIRYINRLKELDNTIKNIGKDLEQKAQVAKTLSETGDKYKENNFLELAAQNYKLGLSIFPEDSELNYKLAIIMANLGLFYKDKMIEYFTQAEDLYRKSLTFPPKIGRANYGLAILYLSCYENKVNFGNLAMALDCINKYLADNSNMVDAYFLKARILVNMNQNPQAIGVYQTILNLTKPISSEYKTAKENIENLAG